MAAPVITTTNSVSTSSTSTFQERVYQAFSGSNFVKNSTSIHLKVLYGLVYSPDVDPFLAEKVFSAAQKDFEKHRSAEKSESPTCFPSVADSDELTAISYGGGRRFLQAFLSDGHAGYASEAGGQGMFVTTDPTMRHRDIKYATRTPLANFDDPVVMTAQIAKRHLQQVNHNSYEAVLPQKSVQYLQNHEVTNFELKKLPSWKEAVADLLPLIPFNSFGQKPAYLTKLLESTNKYSADEIRDIISYLLPFYS